MNRKVYPLMLVLCIVFLAFNNVIKLFIPNYFNRVITNPQLIKLGEMVDSNVVLFILFGLITSTLTYWLFFSACNKALITKPKYFVLFVLFYFINFVITKYNTDLSFVSNSLTLLLFATHFNKKIIDNVIIFILHTLFQYLTLERISSDYLIYVTNSIQALAITFDAYIWLTVILITRLKYKEVFEWRTLCHHFTVNLLSSLKILLQSQTHRLKICILRLSKKKDLSKSVKKHLQTSKKKIEHIKSSKFRLQLELFKLRLYSYGLALATLFLCAYFSNQHLGLFYFCIAHTVIRQSCGKQYHSDSVHICLFITSGIIFFAALSLYPITSNTLYPIVLAFLISWVGTLVVDNVDKDKIIQEFKNIFTPKQQLKKKLNDNGFYNLHEQIALLYCIDRLTMPEVANQTGYSLQTCRNYFGQITKVLPELKKIK